jgi:hypothetical protein
MFLPLSTTTTESRRKKRLSGETIDSQKTANVAHTDYRSGKDTDRMARKKRAVR